MPDDNDPFALRPGETDKKDDRPPVHIPIPFPRLPKLDAPDQHRAAALRVLQFLNKFEVDTIGYQEPSEVTFLRVELLADMLRKEFPK